MNSLPIQVLLWLCIAIFGATGLIALLALIGKVELGGKHATPETRLYFLKKLFLGLIVQIAVAGAGLFVAVIDSARDELKVERDVAQDTAKKQETKITDLLKKQVPTTNPTWTPDNRAHLLTWLVLTDLDQSKKTFLEIKAQTMGQLEFWKLEDRKKEAHTLARKLDEKFTKGYRATYKEGADLQKAVKGIQEVLMTEAATTQDLANKVGEFYRLDS